MNGKESVLQNIQLHLKKCSKLITNVVAPACFMLNITIEMVKAFGSISGSFISSLAVSFLVWQFPGRI